MSTLETKMSSAFKKRPAEDTLIEPPAKRVRTEEDLDGSKSISAEDSHSTFASRADTPKRAKVILSRSANDCVLTRQLNPSPADTVTHVNPPEPPKTVPYNASLRKKRVLTRVTNSINQEHQDKAPKIKKVAEKRVLVEQAGSGYLSNVNINGKFVPAARKRNLDEADLGDLSGTSRPCKLSKSTTSSSSTSTTSSASLRKPYQKNRLSRPEDYKKQLKASEEKENLKAVKAKSRPTFFAPELGYPPLQAQKVQLNKHETIQAEAKKDTVTPAITQSLVPKENSPRIAETTSKRKKLDLGVVKKLHLQGKQEIQDSYDERTGLHTRVRKQVSGVYEILYTGPNNPASSSCLNKFDQVSRTNSNYKPVYQPKRRNIAGENAVLKIMFGGKFTGSGRSTAGRKFRPISQPQTTDRKTDHPIIVPRESRSRLVENARAPRIGMSEPLSRRDITSSTASQSTNNADYEREFSTDKRKIPKRRQSEAHLRRKTAASASKTNVTPIADDDERMGPVTKNRPEGSANKTQPFPEQAAELPTTEAIQDNIGADMKTLPSVQTSPTTKETMRRSKPSRANSNNMRESTTIGTAQRMRKGRNASFDKDQEEENSPVDMQQRLNDLFPRSESDNEDDDDDFRPKMK